MIAALAMVFAAAAVVQDSGDSAAEGEITIPSLSETENTQQCPPRLRKPAIGIISS